MACRCLPTKPVISNIVTSPLPITARSLSSQRMLRLLAGFCRLWALGINPFTKEETVFKAKPATVKLKVRPLKKLKDAAL